MDIRKLNKTEVEQVAGGVLPTQYASLDTSFSKVVSSTEATVKSPIGNIAACCCCCHCCGTHSSVGGIGGVVNPATR